MGNVTSGEYPYAFGPNPERRLGRSIKLMRGHRGMSQADLASSLNQLGKTRFTQSMIAKTEAGDRPIRLNEALDFAFVLGEELELLLLLEDDEQMLAELGEIQERLGPCSPGARARGWPARARRSRVRRADCPAASGEG